MKCVLCKDGTTAPGRVTVVLEKNDSLIVIKNVPAEVCSNCGHYYLTDEMSRVVLEKGREAIKKGTELEVLRLNVA